MVKSLATALVVVSMFAGAAYAKGGHMHHKHHHHMMSCAQGMAKATCVCGTPKQHSVCHAGQWCHPFNGACTK